MLSQAVTLAESARESDQQLTRRMLRELKEAPAAGYRIGVTGAPGAGKSTLIEAWGLHLIAQGHRVAVLAIDPSSPRAGGSLLGDKTRMTQLATHPQAWVRPSPTRGTLGGVHPATPDAVRLCEAAGFDIILIETVGVGQSEYRVRQLVDALLLLLPPAAGDELQGLKRGIVEMADLLVVTKAAGGTAALAERAVQDYAQAVRHMEPYHPGWATPVLATAAMEGLGLAELWHQLNRLRQHLFDSGRWKQQRVQQQTQRWRELAIELVQQRMQQAHLQPLMQEMDALVADGVLLPSEAAEQVLNALVATPPA